MWFTRKANPQRTLQLYKGHNGGVKGWFGPLGVTTGGYPDTRFRKNYPHDRKGEGLVLCSIIQWL